MPKVELLAASKPSALIAPLLDESFIVHDRLHELDPAAFARAAPNIRGIVAVGESRITRELISQLPALEIISLPSVGYDGVDVEAAVARGIQVTHTPGVLNDDVADLAIALMLGVSRSLVQADQYVRDGSWAKKGPMELGRKMSGARLGIVGMGRIGKAIAERAAAFKMPVAYTARSAKADLPYRFYPDAVALATESDYLVVITPGGAGTRKLIDAKVLKALGPEGILVNVARGSVVDEAALISALQKGEIAGAGLDVFENEPNVPEALCKLNNVLLAPHIGSATRSTRQAMADLAVANLRAHFAGQPLLSPVPECRKA